MKDEPEALTVDGGRQAGKVPVPPSATSPSRPLFIPQPSSLILLLALFGVALRVLRYAQGRDLWLDEVFLANNLLHKTPLQLLGPLDYRQGAPPLFLLLCKLSIALFGPSEYALRLVPLLAGVAGVVLFYFLVRRLLNAAGAHAAMALFAVLEPLIYYASEIKQYSTDVAVAIGLLLAFVRYDEHPERRGRLAALAALGVAALFLSHPSVFVLGAGSLWLLFRRRKVTPDLLVLAGCWGAALVADYVVFLRPLAANEGLQHHWASGYPPRSAAIFGWLYDTYLGVFRGYSTMWLWFESYDAWPAKVAAVLSLVGWLGLWLRRRTWAGLVTLPIVLTLAAAFVHKYPFDGRLILFLVPLFVISIGACVGWATESGRVAKGVAIVLLLAVILPATVRTIDFAVDPPRREEITPVMAYLRDHWRDGDKLYLYHAADAPYLYYRKQVGMPDVPFVHGRRELEEPGAFERDAESLAGKGRVWVLFSHVWTTPDGDEEERIVSRFQRFGTQADASHATGASVYLFEMAPAPTTAPVISP